MNSIIPLNLDFEYNHHPYNQYIYLNIKHHNKFHLNKNLIPNYHLSKINKIININFEIIIILIIITKLIKLTKILKETVVVAGVK